MPVLPFHAELVALPMSDHDTVPGNTHVRVPEPFVVSTAPSDPAVSGNSNEYPAVAAGAVRLIVVLLLVCNRNVRASTGIGS